MTEQVPADRIEELVGIDRHPTLHYARIDTESDRVFILHSGLCLSRRDDLRTCPYSRALDKGIDLLAWGGLEDVTVVVRLRRSRTLGGTRLTPMRLP